MKTVVLSLLACLFVLALPGQDLIYLKDGTEIKAKVEEVGLEAISFRYFQDLSGPTHELRKTELEKIVYENGYEEMYDAATAPPPSPAPVANASLDEVLMRSGERLQGKVEEVGEDFIRFRPLGASKSETLLKAKVAAITYASGYVDEFAAASPPAAPQPPVSEPQPAAPVALPEVDIEEPVPAPETTAATDSTEEASPSTRISRSRKSSFPIGKSEAYLLLYSGGGAGSLKGGAGLAALAARADSLSQQNGREFDYTSGSRWEGGFQVGLALGLQMSPRLALEAGLQYQQQAYSAFLLRAYSDPTFQYDSRLDSSVFYRRRSLAIPVNLSVSLMPGLAVTAGLQVSTTLEATAQERTSIEETINQEPVSIPEGVQQRTLAEAGISNVGVAGQAGLRLGRPDGLMFHLQGLYQPGAVTLAGGKAHWVGLQGWLSFAF